MSESLVDLEERFFVCGITGSGKTTFCTKVYDNLDTLCIYINTSDEVLPEQHSDAIVNTPDQIAYAINKKCKKICLSPQREKDITEKDIEQIRDILFAMGQKINEKRREPLIWCHIFIDEVHEYSSVHRKNVKIDSIWKRGRRYGIIGVAISQRPSDVSHTILTQSRTHIIFEVSPYEVPYFSHYRIPIEEHQEWVEQKYHFLVFDGARVKRAKPIKI